ncbi:hypothetical protein AB4Z35_09050 [Pseudomonas sp. KB_15]|uniref:hypothetical protein n=1 Tax=Pseudomonas sp. KB_15 TaxID=3233035 RepID=UPI003F9A9B3C
MVGTAPALIAFISAILVGFVTHFVAEDYRRFRDGQAVAASLAGELDSITSSLPDLHHGLADMKDMLENLQPLPFPEFPDQTSPIFEANTTKVGLLGAELAGEVAYIYDQISAFRTSFQLLSKHHPVMPESWSCALVGRCMLLIESNEHRARNLIVKLKDNSSTNYVMSRPFGAAVIFGGTLIGLSSLFGAAFSALAAS